MATKVSRASTLAPALTNQGDDIGELLDRQRDAVGSLPQLFGSLTAAYEFRMNIS